MGLCDQKRNEMLCEYLVVFLIVFPAVFFLWWVISKDKETHCDIIVREWSAVLLTIYLAWRTVSLFQIVFMYNCFEHKHISSYLFFLIGASFVFGWIILGNVWFSSDKNNCKDVESTEPYWYLMLALVIIGDIFILIYIVALFIIPCIFINFSTYAGDKVESRSPKNHWNDNIIARSSLNPRLIAFEHNCILCKKKFIDDQLVSQLPCAKNHYMHT